MPPSRTTPLGTAGQSAVGVPPAEAVAPLLRGVAVLRTLTDAGGTLSLSELERATGLARSTVDRVTGTLARMGYLRLDGRDATLSPRLMELGNSYLAALRLPGLLDGYAEQLADELDESVSLAVPDGDGIRFIHQATRRRTMSLSFRIGDLLPAERTAPGPVFAADWTEAQWARWAARRDADPEDRGFPGVPPRGRDGRAPRGRDDFAGCAARARDRGWAVDDQLIEPGLIALAGPVRDPDGRVVCAVSVVSHTSRHSADSLPEVLLPHVRTTVAAMERELRRAGSSPAGYTPVGGGTPTPAGYTPVGGGTPTPAGYTPAGGGTPTPAGYTPAGGGTPSPAAGPSGLAAWTGASKQELGREFVESLARGLTVLTAFGEGREALTLAAVARATGLARATARRALITWEHLGYVAVAEGTFRLTPRVLALGFPPLSRTTLPQIATPHLAALARRVHDSASLAVLAGDDVQYTARVATSRIMSVNITLGTRFPAYATSMGRVLLAGLPDAERAARLARTELRPLTPYTLTRRPDLAKALDRVRREGYALVDEELEEGLRSIAVPVRDRDGEVVAAVNVAMHSSRRSAAECVAGVLPELRAEVARIEADLHVAGRFARIPAA